MACKQVKGDCIFDLPGAMANIIRWYEDATSVSSVSLLQLLVQVSVQERLRKNIIVRMKKFKKNWPLNMYKACQTKILIEGGLHRRSHNIPLNQDLYFLSNMRMSRCLFFNANLDVLFGHKQVCVLNCCPVVARLHAACHTGCTTVVSVEERLDKHIVVRQEKTNLWPLNMSTTSHAGCCFYTLMFIQVCAVT